MRKIRRFFAKQTSIFGFFASLFILGWAAMGGVCANDAIIPAYGRFETSFSVSLDGINPFDASDIQVDAMIQKENQDAVTVPCYFDGEDWKLRFTPALPGSYTYRIQARTATEITEITTGSFRVTEAENRGFVRIGKKTSRHFVFERGGSYFPLGENLGWVQHGGEPLLENWVGYLDECAQAGMNWIRIWMCPWGMTELTWTPFDNRYSDYMRYDMVNAGVIDEIFQEAEKRGIYIQWVINHHGQYSKATNPVWNENPFNVKNGGFLEEPSDFFTQEQAKSHYRNRLRYLVARWGCSTHLMAWEFWNEVDLTSNFDVDTVCQWHEEMARFLRELDPYDHLQTTSTSGGNEKIYAIEGLDFIQTHAYDNNLIGTLVSTSIDRFRKHPHTPHLFGEMAYDWRGPTKLDPTGISLHNQLWASVHGTRDAGTAMTWWWDNWVRPNNLYPHFRALANYLDGIDWDRENPIPLKVAIEPQEANRCAFNFSPGIGWGDTQRSHFVIRETGEIEGLSECTQFVHGNGHRDMAPNPIFVLELDHPTHFGFQISEISQHGAHCTVELDGKEFFQRAFAPAEKDSTMGQEGYVSLPVPSGRHTIQIKNTGQDWFRIPFYSVEGLVQRPQAFARGNRDFALLWVHDRLHQLAYLTGSRQSGVDVPDADKPDAVAATTLTLPDLVAGDYIVESFDPYTGESGDFWTIQSQKKGLVIPIPSFEKDMAFRIRR